ncbi:MAG: helix-turn-helix domain-containing protein [Desulfurivibrionaceae bacterium]|nr:helix-turn-helix domain-containing protein [Desulfurivibrionaceae bacterium]
MSLMTKDSPSADDAIEQPAALSRSDETLGSFLKRHRQSQGKELEEIAKKTRIHASTLRAIEEDNPKALPADVFARGFIKNYAQYLGLDPNEALAWYIEQNAGETKPPEKINVQEVLAGEAMAEVQTFPFGRFVGFFVVVGVLFLAGYLVLNFLNSSAPPADVPGQEINAPALVQPQPPPAPVTGEPGEAIPEGGGSEAGQPESVTDGAAQAPPLPLSGAEKTGPEGTGGASLPEKAGNIAETQKVEPDQSLEVKKKTDEGRFVILPRATKEKPGQTPESQDVVKPAAVAAVSPPPSLVKQPGMNYVLEAKFTETTWLSVQIDKEKKKSAIYRPGDRLVLQAAKKISLFVGNAGGVSLTLNGKPVPSIGKSMESARVSFPIE